MASKKKKPGIGSAILVLAVIVAIAVLGYAGVMSRDYNLTSEGWVAKISIPSCRGYRVTSEQSSTILITCDDIQNVDGQEFRISRWENLIWTGKTYETSVEFKAIGGFTTGETYYVQGRCYKTNATGRKIFGQWSSIKSVRVK